MGLFLYNIVWWIVVVLFFPFIALACMLREKWRKTFWKRLGFQVFPDTGQERPVWVHALSVGEMRAAAPLVAALSGAGFPVVLSASTQTGFEAAQGLVPACKDRVFFFPYDLAPCVRAALARVRPAACVLVESDIWPNLIHEADREKIPVLLANGRLSGRSLAGYRRFSWLMGPVFGGFGALGVQSVQQRERFLRLGVSPDRLHVTGNLKFDTAPALADAARPEAAMGTPLVVAGSTHAGEEKILEGLLARCREQGRNLFLMIAPRDPKRAREVARLFSDRGWSVSLYPEASGAGSDVAVVNRMGLLAGLYALGDACFVGGSLVPEGGHNPLEPAACARPVLFGPDMGDFPEIARTLVEQGGAVRVPDADGLFLALKTLLDSPEKARAMGERARKVVEQNQGAVERTLAMVQGVLDESH